EGQVSSPLATLRARSPLATLGSRASSLYVPPRGRLRELGHDLRQRGRRRLPLHVLPVPRLALGHPFDRGVQALAARLVRLRLGDPLQVLALVARAEALERRPRLRALLQRGSELRGHRDLLLRVLQRPRDLDPLLVQLRGLPD